MPVHVIRHDSQYPNSMRTLCGLRHLRGDRRLWDAVEAGGMEACDCHKCLEALVKFGDLAAARIIELDDLAKDTRSG